MERIPISFEEKIEARFTRRGKGACWPWDGSVAPDNHRPRMNWRDVIRFIYARERGPIPPGHVLIRTDHQYYCKRGTWCEHYICVNPWHVEPMLPFNDRWGLYPRDNYWPGTDTSEVNSQKRRARRNRKTNGHDRDSQGLDAAEHGDGSEGTCMEGTDERQRTGTRDSSGVRGEPESLQ